jgi:hypothetical protein
VSFEEDFARAQHETRIHRGRRSRLLTVGSTELPYVLLNRSVVNEGDTVVRRGVLRVEEPTILLLQRPHQFEGFRDDQGDHEEAMLALGRMAHLPPARYSNRDVEMAVMDGDLDRILLDFDRALDVASDERTGLLSGPVEVWHFSLMVYVGQMVRQSAGDDVSELMRRLGER